DGEDAGAAVALGLGGVGSGPEDSWRIAVPPDKRAGDTARAATSEWGWWPIATFQSTRSNISRGTFSAPTTIRRSSVRTRGATFSTGSPYIVRWTFDPDHPPTTRRHGTPV